MLTTQQAADKLGISRSRVHALLRAGRLRAVKLGRDWTIDPKDLAAVRVRKVGRPKGK